ncbi:Ribonuclease H domain [Macleaya cordata]|uniref:Ribonuclease H domain n=1 Tax=Macleaya cordata TaxID=56857 RepID=A0A200QBK6_MACCD|nr:Ribonuclease H domain [Macleaya cordata]
MPPEVGQIKLGCDGCSRGNPGPAGAGMVLRGSDGGTIGAMAVGLGICTNFIAEILAIILGLEWAKNLGLEKIWVTSDSHAAIRCFNDNKIPWFVLSRWTNLKKNLILNFSLVYRETNFAADSMSKKEALLPLGISESFDHRPYFLTIENPATTYFRFS